MLFHKLTFLPCIYHQVSPDRVGGGWGGGGLEKLEAAAPLLPLLQRDFLTVVEGRAPPQVFWCNAPISFSSFITISQGSSGLGGCVSLQEALWEKQKKTPLLWIS